MNTGKTITTDYSIFKESDKNRENRTKILNSAKFNDIKRSLTEFGQKSPVIIGLSNVVSDGQTRLHALEILNMPVWYEIREETDDALDMSMLEEGLSKKWTTLDVCNFWEKKGIAQYGNLKEIVKKTGIPMSYLSELNNAANGTPIQSHSYEFTRGKFPTFDHNKLMKYSLVLKPIINTKKFTTARTLVNVFAYAIETIGFKKTEELFDSIFAMLKMETKKITQDQTVHKLYLLSRKSKHRIDFPSSLTNK